MIKYAIGWCTTNMIVGCWNSIENFAKETSLWQCVEGLKVDTSWVLKLLFCITYSMGVSAYRVIEKLDANVIRIMSKEWGLRDIWVQHRWLHRGECLLSSGIVALKKKKGYLIGNVLFSFVLGSRIPQMVLYIGGNPRFIFIHHI